MISAVKFAKISFFYQLIFFYDYLTNILTVNIDDFKKSSFFSRLDNQLRKKR